MMNNNNINKNSFFVIDPKGGDDRPHALKPEVVGSWSGSTAPKSINRKDAGPYRNMTRVNTEVKS